MFLHLIFAWLALHASHAQSSLRGFADLHAHPMSHLGFGQTMLHGAPDGPIHEALGDCTCLHAGNLLDFATAPTCTNVTRSLVNNLIDQQMGFVFQTPLGHPSGGYPNFEAWPHHSSVTHQQMWYEWIRRSYDSGLRVMVALAVNNHLLAEVTAGRTAKTDKEAGDLQIREMKAFVARHSDFMEIAYSPEDLRSIVSRNKLAVILGVELDNLGNLNLRDASVTEAQVHTEVRRLYSNGVRYIFPIHLTDNPLGGPALTEGGFVNVANRFAQAQPLPPESGARLAGTSFHIEHAPDPNVTLTMKPVADSRLLRAARVLLQYVERIPGLQAHIQRHLAYRTFRSYILAEDVEYHPERVAPGHRNSRGLTPAGISALREMMALGMMIDVDHMSEHSLAMALDVAESIPGGYPLNSGHTSFRTLGHPTEFGRSDEQMDRLRPLGGMVGVSLLYRDSEGPMKTASQALSEQHWPRTTRSDVTADCAGSSTRFAQDYIYAVEKNEGRVAFGTDANGFAKFPGPRFGALAHRGKNYCGPQRNPVRYGEGGRLTRTHTGNKFWDINTEGAAHYGMLPDFIEDLRQIGIHDADLEPLFRGAENVAQMWEKSVRLSSQR
jgi:microsomal dipeptidase-like Zn-dependent dipeptidase